MPSARTTGEYYRLVTDLGASRPGVLPERYDDAAVAARAAMQFVLDTGKSCELQRVTTHEPVERHILGSPVDGWPPEIVAETVTGRLTVPGPEGYARRPEMSRYHPVNGWAVPETIEVSA